ncbi:sugar phosphate isomerase/epimerase family protein [Maritalea sp.]|uniref:sugar phosphate isomerase/epimerase family protein n=1 Tax=Maritalea sp. TaxID=2003361 RepID=UPI003EF27A85
MTIKIGNAPCSWGVEFGNDPRNPNWLKVLDECKQAGYTGIELGPVGFMPEEPNLVADEFAKRELEMIGGVIFRPFHDPDQWDDVLDGAVRTCEALKAHGAEHLVLIDSISPRRAPTAGRPQEAEKMDDQEWRAYRGRIEHVAKLGAQDYGLTPSIHPHAAGFMDFEDEVEKLLSEVDESVLKICLDTGHSHYAGFDPVVFMKRHMDRISYMHFKDIDPKVKAHTIENQIDFYEACGNGIFCNLGDGETDFPAVRDMLMQAGFEGWCTVEQDCDPEGDTSPVSDAKLNRDYLASIGFEVD